MPVHADPARLVEMGGRDPDEPVFMLNLLRYRETAESGHGVDGMSGRDAYGVYGRKFAELNPRFGGEPVFMGRVGAGVIVDEHESWDVMILVRYPTRRQFVEMLADPSYQAIAPIRAAALADSRLIETTDLLGTHAGGG